MIRYRDLLTVGGAALLLALARNLFVDILPNGQFARALANFRQVGTPEAVCPARQMRQVDVFRHGRLAQVGLQRQRDRNAEIDEIRHPL